MSQSQPTLPTEAQLQTWVGEFLTIITQAASLVDADDVEVRGYSSTGQVEVIYRNTVEPGMADGTAGTPDAPAEPTDADRNANTDLGRTLATGFRSRGGEVELTDRGETVVVRATFTDTSSQ